MAEGSFPAPIRPYEPGDLETCRSLWAELTEWHRRIYGDPRIGGPDPGRHFDAQLQKSGPENFWVAELQGRVVGLAGLIVQEREAELEPLIVSEKCRGQGIGKRLAETVVAAAQERGLRGLSVRPVARNEEAIGFFHKLGFDVLGQVEMYLDFRPRDRQDWKGNERLAGKEFRV